MITSRHPKNKFPDRDLVLTLVDVDVKSVDYIPIKHLYAGALTKASKALSKGIQYVHNRSMGKTFRMELRALWQVLISQTKQTKL